MDTTSKKTIHVAIPLELYEQLKVLADKTGRTVPGYARQILKYYIRYLADDPTAQSQTGLVKIPWPAARE